MKYFMQSAIVVASISVTIPAFAASYYVDPAGNDAADGKSPATAWKTVAKVNGAALAPGDSVLFLRGATFHDTLMPANSGSAGKPITFGAYGNGAKPLFSALSVLSGWSSSTPNIWTTSVPNGAANLRSLVIGGALQTLGRYPRANAANYGYLTVSSHSGQSSITDATLAATPNFTGGEIYLRMASWIAYRGTITAHTSGTLKFADTGTQFQDGFGYFIQNHPATLTTQGDWYYDATNKKVGIYYVGMPPAVRVPTLDRLVSLTGRNYISLTDLAFEGANGSAVYGISSSFLTVRNCTIDLAGTFAIESLYSTDVAIDANIVTRSIGNAISVYSGSSMGNVAVTDNSITDTGTIAGMAAPSSQNQGISVTVSSNATIERNLITRTGYDGIIFAGNDIMVRNNVIDTFCSVLDDGGAIYAWDGPMTAFSNRKVLANIILNGVGSPGGIPKNTTAAQGIYLDNNTNHVEVLDNTVYKVANTAFYGNSNQYVTLKRNTFVDHARGWQEARWVDDGSTGSNRGQDVLGLDIEDNIFVEKTAAQTSFQYVDFGINFPSPSTLRARLGAMGTVDHNFYYAPSPLPFGYYARNDKASPYAFPPNQGFSQWQTTSGLEGASTLVPLVAAENMRFEMNTTALPLSLALDTTYADLRGLTYCGTIHLAAFSSLVLIKSQLPCTPGLDADGGAGTQPGVDGGTHGGVKGGAVVPADDQGASQGSGCACSTTTPQTVPYPSLISLAVGVYLGSRRRRQSRAAAAAPRD